MGTPLTVGPTPLGVMEPLIYVLASAIAVSVAVLAGLPAARRATAVQPWRYDPSSGHQARPERMADADRLNRTQRLARVHPNGGAGRHKCRREP